ncbi:hypothetical protein LPB41_02215 [Thalassospira sp. MA62]|nr:hypothetical protein [Thalassospira sp. MA62]
MRQLVQDDAYEIAHQDGWQGIVPTFLFAVAGVVLLIFLSYQPAAHDKSVGMVFPFSMTETEIMTRVAANDGRVVRFGGFGHMAVVVRDDGQIPNPSDFGAWFAVSPIIVSSCFDRANATNSF